MSQLYESHNDIFSLLPVKLYKHDLTGNNINVSLHWHRSLEITVTLTGCIRYNTGSNNFDFGESDWIIINHSELHSCRYINPTDHFSGISIIISMDFLEKWLGKDLFFYNPQNEFLTSQIKSIAHELFFFDMNAHSASLVLMSKLYEIMYLISKYCINHNIKYSSSYNPDLQLATALTDYIEQHYFENISLHSVAKHFKYSESYFSRMFKKTLGVNFHAYLNFVRVNHAAEQLSSQKISITECAFQNGFPNTKSFINIFKRVYGCTPGNFISTK